MRYRLTGTLVALFALTLGLARMGSAQYLSTDARWHPVYVQAAGGESMPQGSFNNNFKKGWDALASVGWQPKESGIGLRMDAVYDRMNGRTIVVGGVPYRYDYSAHYGGLADVTARFAMGTSRWRPAAYLLGGGGLHYFKTYGYGTVGSPPPSPGAAPPTSSPSSPSSSSPTYTPPGSGTSSTSASYNASSSSRQYSSTRLGLNGGAGLSVGMGRADVFVESRYITVFTQQRNTNFVPLVVGLTLR